MQAYSPLSAFCSDYYRGIPASAASNHDAAFFVHNTDRCVNFKINTAMLKNNSNVPAAYVSPAVKWVKISTRKSMMYTSPTGGGLDFGNDPGSIRGLDDEADYGDI